VKMVLKGKMTTTLRVEALTEHFQNSQSSPFSTESCQKWHFGR